MFSKLVEKWKIAKWRKILKETIARSDLQVKDANKLKEQVIKLLQDNKDDLTLECEDGSLITEEDIKGMNNEELLAVLQAMNEALKEHIGEKD